ncbi:MAG TPA: hypothetical protein VMH87_07275 [Pseudomonadales bacterium]|nr:hypothetical protein [Pseudomonadales bacterium]
MKALFLSLGLVLAAFVTSAQVSVSVTMDQEHFLPGESVPVYVHITNRSGETLHLGADNVWLSFLVESKDGPVVSKKSDPPVYGPFDLGTSEVATKRVDLGPYFGLGSDGRFKVTATVHIGTWNTDITSPSQDFDVIHGSELWAQTFGVPNSQASNSPPDVRKYTLIEANYLRDQLRLYVQVTDESSASVVKVRAIGPMISFGQPEAQLDPASDLHVLYQDGATTFIYAIVNPNGEIIKQDRYNYVKSHPRLHQEDNGSITVQGGVRRADTSATTVPEQAAR